MPILAKMECLSGYIEQLVKQNRHRIKVGVLIKGIRSRESSRETISPVEQKGIQNSCHFTGAGGESSGSKLASRQF